MSVLLAYQDPSRGLVLMSVAMDNLETTSAKEDSGWAWREETDLFNSVLRSNGNPSAHLASACSALMPFNKNTTDHFLMSCFAYLDSTPSQPSYGGGIVSFRFGVSKTSLFNVTLWWCLSTARRHISSVLLIFDSVSAVRIHRSSWCFRHCPRLQTTCVVLSSYVVQSVRLSIDRISLTDIRFSVSTCR